MKAARKVIGSPQRWSPTSASSRSTNARKRARPGLDRGPVRLAARRCMIRGTPAPAYGEEEQHLPVVWPSPTPTAIGTGPATAETWETHDVGLGVDQGHEAETMPKPTEVSSAPRSGQPKAARLPCPTDLAKGLLDQCREMMQPGDLGIQERRAAEAADGDHAVAGQRSDDDRRSPQPGRQPESRSTRWVGSNGAKRAASSASGRGPGWWSRRLRLRADRDQGRPVGPEHHRAQGHQRLRRVGRIGGHPLQRLQVGLQAAALGIAGDPLHLTPWRLWQAVTIISGRCLGGRSTMKSSTTVPSPFSTISTTLMSAPTPPRAVATPPREPGRSGSRIASGTRHQSSPMGLPTGFGPMSVDRARTWEGCTSVPAFEPSVPFATPPASSSRWSPRRTTSSPRPTSWRCQSRSARNISFGRSRGGEGPVCRAAEALVAWLATGFSSLGDKPTFTIYRMRFTDASAPPGPSPESLGGLEVVDEGAGGVLPHERTTPKASTDRLDLTRATGANLSPVWGLSWPRGSARCSPNLANRWARVDENGVDLSSSASSTRNGSRAIQPLLAADDVLIADGHHRYASAGPTATRYGRPASPTRRPSRRWRSSASWSPTSSASRRSIGSTPGIAGLAGRGAGRSFVLTALEPADAGDPGGDASTTASSSCSRAPAPGGSSRGRAPSTASVSWTAPGWSRRSATADGELPARVGRGAGRGRRRSGRRRGTDPPGQPRRDRAYGTGGPADAAEINLLHAEAQDRLRASGRWTPRPSGTADRPTGSDGLGCPPCP